MPFLVLGISEAAAERALVFAVLACALVLFAWGRWRYDVVAIGALLVLTLAGIIPAREAFLGFGHPAVITVAAVLVISQALVRSGAVDVMAARLALLGDRPVVHLAGLTGLVVAMSAFMNNVGALALLMPVALRMARDGGYSPSLLLMPIAFGSLLGGMTTLIGTPPNVIIGTLRAEAGGDGGFSMFDFTPVGAGLALAGMAFTVLVGWRLVPQRTGGAGTEDLFEISGYLAELRVPEDSEAAGMTIHNLEASVERDITILGIVRGDRRLLAPSAFEVIREDDILLVEADASTLEEIVADLGVELTDGAEEALERISSDDVELLESVVLPRSPLEGQSAASFHLRTRFGINLLAVSRRGSRLRERLANIRLAAGDVLLLQGPGTSLREAMPALGSAPIASRPLNLQGGRRLALAAAIFAAALVLTALGVLEVQVALAAAALVLVLAGIISLQGAYDAVDWPILLLLGAMIPVGAALESTGGASLIADQLLGQSEALPIALSILLVLAVSALLSDIVNNAAAAVLMAPIAISLAGGLDASADPFLMAVAVGASAAFLTPIGHQSNLLVMEPGAYRFGDYWRLGLPLQVLVLLVAVPLILLVWPP